MPKTPPHERWNLHVLERIQAFHYSPDLPRLRAMGLGILGREEMFGLDEQWSIDALPNPEDYRQFQRDCGEVGGRYGLAPWTVEWISLFKDFDPSKSGLVLEVDPPVLRVVTEVDNELFFRWLMYEAWELKKLTVTLQTGSMITPMVVAPRPEKPETALDVENRPPLSTAFKIVPEIPPNYPPQAAAELGRLAANVQRELAGRLGYKVSQRMRASSQTQNASILRVGEETIKRREIYGIVDEMYGEGDMSEDQLRRNRTKNQRHQLRKRLFPGE